MGEADSNLKQLPLCNMHAAAGAKFGAFAGWYMPITYPLGVMKEHLHTREAAGLFDISHMKLIQVEGPEAGTFLSHCLPLDAHGLNIGQSRYSYLLNDAAGILDDLIITRLGESCFMVVANAGNAANDIAQFNQRLNGYNCTITPLDRVFLALQGPQAIDVMRDLGLAGCDLIFMHGLLTDQDWFITRSGYTGEDGFEIALPLDQAAALAENFINDARVEWIGLAARDSLRLEAGLCLHGQDITASINPIEAGITWAVSKSVRESAKFLGASAFNNLIMQGARQKRVGLAPQSRQPVRAGAELFNEAGEKIGIVTSGGFGPSFDAPVAMGYVPNAFAVIGTQIFTEVRGKKIPVLVHALPFVPQNYFKG